MQKLDRRAALGLLLGGAVVATGVAALPGEAEAAPLPQLPELDGVSQVENAQIYIGIPRRRRRRRWVCWRNRWGRRVCGWR